MGRSKNSFLSVDGVIDCLYYIARPQLLASSGVAGEGGGERGSPENFLLVSTGGDRVNIENAGTAACRGVGGANREIPLEKNQGRPCS